MDKSIIDHFEFPVTLEQIEDTEYAIGTINHPSGISVKYLYLSGERVVISGNEYGFASMFHFNRNVFIMTFSDGNSYYLLDLKKKQINNYFGQIKTNSLLCKSNRIFMDSSDLPGIQMYDNNLDCILVDGRHKTSKPLYSVSLKQGEQFFLANFKSDANWFPRGDDGKAFPNFKKKFFAGFRREDVKWLHNGKIFFNFKSEELEHKHKNGWYLWDMISDNEIVKYTNVKLVGNTNYWVVTGEDPTKKKFVDYYLNDLGYATFDDSPFSNTQNALMMYKDGEIQEIAEFEKMTNKLKSKEEKVIEKKEPVDA